MSSRECISKLSEHLFWDIDMSQGDMGKAPAQIIQCVLEYSEMNDWRLILDYYGLDRIVEVCKQLRS